MKAPSLTCQLRYVVALGVAAVLASCAAPPTREIDLDQAVAIADRAAKRSLDSKWPSRVLIATEKDVRSVRRCLHDDYYDRAYVQSVREKVAGHRLYVIRYPLPPVTLEDGDMSVSGTEPCVLLDRGTGEVLGVFSD
jgi:hypothetical protein